MKNIFNKVLSAFVISFFLFVSLVANAEPIEDPGSDRDFLIELSPAIVFSQSDFNLNVSLENADLNLPDVEWPNIEGDLSDWIADPDNADAFAIFAAAYDQELINGKDYARFLLVKTDEEDETIIMDIYLLVNDHPYVNLSNDGFRLNIPASTDDIDLVAGDYQVVMIGANHVSNEIYFGSLEFTVADFPFFVFDLDLGSFIFPDDGGDENLVPSFIQVNPEFVNVGMEVSVSIFDEDSDSLMTLPEGWAIQVWVKPGDPGDMILTTNDGSISLADDGSYYVFDAPSPEIGFFYFVDLLSPEGVIVWSQDLTVSPVIPEEDENDFFGEDLDDFFDLNLEDLIDFDLLFGNDDEADVAADPAVEEPVEPAPEAAEDAGLEAEPVIVCSDIEDDYWGLEYIYPLIDEGLYPYIGNGLEVNCRSLETVLRKEFTSWLLEAYYPNEFADLGNVDVNNSPFNDLDPSDQYTAAIIKAAELDIIHGHPGGYFKPDDPINRAEVLKILLRSSNLFMAEDDEFTALVDEHALDLVIVDPVMRFTDVQSDFWYYRYLYYAVAEEIIQGYGDNTAKMERGVLFSEAAKMLYLTHELSIVIS